ncbi:hypothetical protein N865_02540 [Intrasporangium oryzae NRRL B-24470]|uniref:Uncharacterized protein n=1 Tax=Intrasporangium oryzae NRRL B-24470 TaxID=1386089 RepID=W9GBM4_9MICO|nr:hypothetical protein [Intrasporangium oryzae]EWT02622.1 hypothetical protein N865_02540 [Intrasporangium oryzae NRRL B-24470]
MRRFAALDLYGTSGTLRRRRIVLAEFVVGTAALMALGAVIWRHGSWQWGVWLMGCGLSYGALAAHAVTLFPTASLEAELSGVDTAAEIRRYSLAQLLLFVPGVVAVAALVEALHPAYRGRARRANRKS